MAVPADVLAVERPTNTVVFVYGKNKDKYGVKERIGCTYKNGKSYPINGPTVGHIIDGKYVPLEVNRPLSLYDSAIALKGWADYELCYKLSEELLKELRVLYTEEDAERILAIAIIRVCNPNISNFAIKDAYEESVLSDLMPGLALSKNTVSAFLELLGKGCDRIFSFMQDRADNVKIDHHLLVDGTLKTNDSTVNTLSDFSRKAKLKGRRDISVLYAFDLEEMKPICSQCFPGNMLDLTSYSGFIKNNGIKSGIVVGDKGFPAKSIEDIVKDNPNLHYFNPMKRSAKLSIDNKMYEFTGILQGSYGFLDKAEPIQYKKVKIKDKNKWLYSFRDSYRAAKEEGDWLKNHQGKEYNDAEYHKKMTTFGTVVFESDVDLTPLDAWKTYSYRWQIELVMRYYKDALCFDTTRVHNDYSVIGSEFINFLSTVITFELIRVFDKENLLEKRTYKELMRVLEKAKKAKIDNEWRLVTTNPSNIEVLQALKLLNQPAETKKRGPGRPPKNPRL